MGYLPSIVTGIVGVVLLVLALLRLIGPVNRLRSGIETLREPHGRRAEIAALRMRVVALAPERARRRA